MTSYLYPGRQGVLELATRPPGPRARHYLMLTSYLYPGRERVLGRQPPVHRQDHARAICRQAPAHRIMRHEASALPPAAMQIEQR
jgi:hypothetical protein